MHWAGIGEQVASDVLRLVAERKVWRWRSLNNLVPVIPLVAFAWPTLALAAICTWSRTRFFSSLARLLPSMKAGLKSGRRLGDNRVIRFCCRRILVFVGALGVLLGRGVATNEHQPSGGT